MNALAAPSALRVAVVIPCYDEAATIREVVEEFHEALRQSFRRRA